MITASNSATSLGLSSDTHKYLLQAVKQRPLGAMSAHQPETPPRYYLSDVVRSKKPTKTRVAGLISRCYEEEVDVPVPIFGRTQTGLMRELKKGEAGVQWFPSEEREILPVKDLQFIDRVYHVGSLCKLSEKDTQSGLVVEVSKTLKLQHIFTKDIIDHPVPEQDVVSARLVTKGDHVIANDWIGEVEGGMDHLIVSVPGHPTLLKANDLSGHAMLGTQHGGELNNMVGATGVTEVECVDIRQELLMINWLALNQKLSPEEQNRRPKPSDIFFDFEKLTLVKAFSDKCHEVGEAVVFRSPELRKKHGGKRSVHGSAKVPVEAMQIVETERKVTVVWQDGTRTEEDAKHLVPYTLLDDHDTWPGDWVWWKPEGEPRVPRIIQSIDLAERTAVVRTPSTPSAEIETVPLLEIDFRGADFTASVVNRGTAVLLCAKKTDFQGPFVTAVGDPTVNISPEALPAAVLGTPARAMAFQEVECLRHKPAKKFAKPTSSLDWYGTVVDVLPDGSCTILLANGETVNETLDKVHILRDSRFTGHGHDFDGDDMDHLADPMGLGFDDPYSEFYDPDSEDYDDDWAEHHMNVKMSGGMGLDVPWMDSTGETIVGDKDEWEDMSEDEEDTQPPRQGKAGTTAPSGKRNKRSLDQSGSDKGAAETPSGKRDKKSGSTDQAASPSPDVSTSLEPTSQPASGSTIQDTTASWTQFAVLESAPTSHGFYKKKIAGSRLSPGFLKRLKKEFKVLQSSLPETILVRAYEDRSDLLRVLIFGSEGTPYEHAPFLLDFQLTPEFPEAPPVAYFHSWTNDHGRVSPNLYEDGNVCLSVLGTWSGHAEENWNPTKSSLLQVFVSIQALVLVREPYYTEPSFEKLKGTPDSQLNSRLYSEKSYILSRGFVRRALEQPIEGLEGEIKMYYLERAGLSKVISRAKALLDQPSSASAGGSAPIGGLAALSDEPLPSLTKGGAIMLRRSVKALEDILVSQSKDSSTSS